MSALVGLVVVSHSRALAQAAVDLARDMLHDVPVRIITAAGLDGTTFGTDTDQVRRAITAADQGAGVVVLMDLGGAVLSAKLALEALGDARSRVVLCPAPLVEGLLVAAVAAAGGASRDEAAAAAMCALASKTELLDLTPAVDHPPDGSPAAGELTGAFTVVNPHGLHARPAARLVREVGACGAQHVEVRNRTTGSAWVPASSLSQILTLGALRGHDIEIRVRGNEAREVLRRLLAMATHGFDEASTEHGGPTLPSPQPVSPGIGAGLARHWQLAPPDVPDSRTADPAQEWRRFQDAITAVRRDLHHLRRCGSDQESDQESEQMGAAIIDALLLLLDDPVLHNEVRSRVDGGQAAAPAWSTAASRIAQDLAAIPDPYLQTRAADLRGLRDQVLRVLLGTAGGTGPPAGVLVCADLTPSEVAGLDPALITAVLLAGGSPTAHSAILLRAKGIPAIVAAGPAVLDIPEGIPVAVDASRGEYTIDPPAAVLDTYRTRATELAQRAWQARAHAAALAATSDDVRVLVGANIGAVHEARAAADLGADLAGLVRTEFLFLDRPQAPDADEQEATYRQIAEHLQGRRITVRTLDVGGDKPLSYLPMPPETNPFLGVRGIRLSLMRPHLLTEQLLAIVRLARDTPVSVMFPMISTLDELRRARGLLDEVITREHRGRPEGLRVGIMVEVPGTALKASVFAPHVDFLSIGTNDLTQYALAAERGNAAVAELGDPVDPGVLRLIDAVCHGAGPAPVAVCGELAADERAIGLLVGLGVRELSVAASAIPAIKQTVRALNSARAAELSAAALDASCAAAVRELLTT